METTIEYWGYIGIMEKKMETTIEYWGYIGIMEKKMETTINLRYDDLIRELTLHGSRPQLACLHARNC